MAGLENHGKMLALDTGISRNALENRHDMMSWSSSMI
jgi:hypothetical protein